MNAAPQSHRLALRFDAAALAEDVAGFAADAWLPHFNIHHHDGGWSGIALRAPGGDVAKLYPDPDAPVPYQATPLLARCPAVQAALAQLRCPIGSVRFLRLAPGSRIREHRDYDLAFADGELRLHIPVTTHPDVEFVLAGRRVEMSPGECWYLNLNHLHRALNRSSVDRVHLVVDCVVNEWLASLFPAEIADASSEARAAFEAFRARVLVDPALQQTLRDAAPAGGASSDFVPRVVRSGRGQDFAFGAPEVLEALREGRRSRIERWL